MNFSLTKVSLIVGIAAGGIVIWDKLSNALETSQTYNEMRMRLEQQRKEKVIEANLGNQDYLKFNKSMTLDLQRDNLGEEMTLGEPQQMIYTNQHEVSDGLTLFG